MKRIFGATVWLGAETRRGLEASIAAIRMNLLIRDGLEAGRLVRRLFSDMVNQWMTERRYSAAPALSAGSAATKGMASNPGTRLNMRGPVVGLTDSGTLA
jgi:hypothetical protein